MLYSLLYRSVGAPGLTDGDVLGILTTSLRRNARAGVTGLLLHADVGPSLAAGPGLGVGQFVQWLEGPEAAVRDLYARIAADPRHTDCETIAEGPAEAVAGRDARLFPHWSMSLERPSTLPVTVEAFLAYYREYVSENGIEHPLRSLRRWW